MLELRTFSHFSGGWCLSDLVPLDCLRYRPLQLYILAHWRPSQGLLTDRIPLDHIFLDPFLQWWTKPSNVLQGRPIQAPPPPLAIYTDVSTSSWEAHCGDQSAAGLWSATETARHINELQLLLAIQRAVLHFLPLIIRGKAVMIHSDNSSAVAYVQNQGGTHSVPMFHLTWGILLECQQQGVTLLVRHIPGRLNVLADRLLRRHRRVASAPQHNMTDVCHLVHSRVGPVPDPQAVAVDALSIPWHRRWVYAHPSAALMQRALHNLVHLDQFRVLLVAPLHHYQPWLPMLLGLLVDFPREVPPLPRLLRRPQLGLFHSHPEQVHLFAWSLSSMVCESNSFQKQLPTISARQLEHLPSVVYL